MSEWRFSSKHVKDSEYCRVVCKISVLYASLRLISVKKYLENVRFAAVQNATFYVENAGKMNSTFIIVGKAVKKEIFSDSKP